MKLSDRLAGFFLLVFSTAILIEANSFAVIPGQSVSSVLLPNILVIFLGYFAIRGARYVVRTPARLLMPVILLFSMVGAFAITNSVFGIAIMLVLGIIGFLMEENGFPISPVILGIVIGPMLEDNFVATVIKTDGNILGFFDRPVSGTLGVMTLLLWTMPLIRILLRKARGRSGAPA